MCRGNAGTLTRTMRLELERIVSRNKHEAEENDKHTTKEWTKHNTAVPVESQHSRVDWRIYPVSPLCRFFLHPGLSLYWPKGGESDDIGRIGGSEVGNETQTEEEVSLTRFHT